MLDDITGMSHSTDLTAVSGSSWGQRECQNHLRRASDDDDDDDVASIADEVILFVEVRKTEVIKIDGQGKSLNGVLMR